MTILINLPNLVINVISADQLNDCNKSTQLHDLGYSADQLNVALSGSLRSRILDKGQSIKRTLLKIFLSNWAGRKNNLEGNYSVR